MLSIRHSIGKTPLLEHMANDSKSVAHFRCYAIAPPTGVYAHTEVGAPAPDERIHLVNQGHGGGPDVLAPESFEFPFDLCDGVGTWFDQQLVATAGAVGGRIMA